METLDLRKKWMNSINKVDERFLRMLDALYESYVKENPDPIDELPELAKKLIDQGLEDVKQGRIYTHDDVMAEFRKKYDIA